MEDQSVEVVGQVGQDQFCFGALDADGADKQAEPVFLMGKDMLNIGAVATGMELPIGLLRWIRPVNIRSDSHFSLL